MAKLLRFFCQQLAEAVHLFKMVFSAFLISDFYVEDEGSGIPPPTAMPQTTLPPTDSPAKERVRQFF